MAEESQPTYFQAGDISEAWQLLEAGGGTAQAAWVSPRPSDPDKRIIETWVDLSALGLDDIQQSKHTLSIGAAATLASLQNSDPLSSAYNGVIAQAVRKTAHHGLRNIAALGAVLEQPGSAPEMAAALLACDSELIFYDGTEQTVPLKQAWNESSFSGLPLELKLDIGSKEKIFASIQWVGRSPMDKAIVTAASCVRVDDGKLGWLTIALAGDGLKAQRLALIEAELAGSEVTSLDRTAFEQLIKSKVKAASSYRASADYQVHLAGTLAWRALATAIAEATS